VFTTEAVSGYPPGTPGSPESYGTEGLLHDLASMPAFLGLPLATLFFARTFLAAGRRGWAAYGVASGAVLLGCFLAASAGFAQNSGLVASGGLYQRIALLAGLGWVTALSVRQLCRRPGAPGP
jgi:hypothetical protein